MSEPAIGEVRRIDGRLHAWTPCSECSTPRWVALTKGRPAQLRCHPCGNRMRKPWVQRRAWVGEDGIGRVELNGGHVALVDAADLERVAAHTWYALVTPRTVYAVRTPANGRRIRMHRELLDAPDGVDVDHKNGDGLDNRSENLRLTTRAGNARNAAKRRSTTRELTSRFKGVFWDKSRRRWVATIRHDGRTVRLGRFLDEESAARAYDAAALRHFGRFARTNLMMGLLP